MKVLTKDHFKYILLFALILAIVYGYNDRAPKFVFQNWIVNFLFIYVFCLISSFIHETTHILTAYFKGCSLNLKFIQFKRYWISTRSYLNKIVKAGFIFPLIITFISNGLFYFPAISTYEVKEEKHLRLGRKFPRLSEWELAQIAVSGPLASILLAVIFKIFDFSLTQVSPVTINIWIAVLNILPLPLFDGYKVFIYSRLLFTITLIFIIILSFLLNKLAPLTSLGLSIVLALVLFLIYLLYPILKIKK